ncbi:C40 family peptidase [Desulfothermobacter acidiphilus]|uniref:C40 family peptidase n=1 Tax=Desulfothermobacter acidiphilus TaxID=1938353 RepID=UPI003F8C7ECA
MVVGWPCTGVYERPDFTAPLVTQALLGEPVLVMERQEDWLRVWVADGSGGWVQRRALTPSVPVTGEPALVIEPVIRTGSTRLYLGTQVWVQDEDGERCRVSSPAGWEGEVAASTIWPWSRMAERGRGTVVVATACSLLGSPYLWGGLTLEGIDCSGLSYIAYWASGYRLPRDADEQFLAGRKVSLADLSPGDLLFFTTVAPGASHVGIYCGQGRFLNARSLQGVSWGCLDDPYFRSRYLGARRYLA